MVGFITTIKILCGYYWVRRTFKFLYLSLNRMFVKPQKHSVHFHIHFLQFFFHLLGSFCTFTHYSHHTLQHRKAHFFDMSINEYSMDAKGQSYRHLINWRNQAGAGSISVLIGSITPFFSFHSHSFGSKHVRLRFFHFATCRCTREVW